MSLGFSTFGEPHRPRKISFDHVDFVPQAILNIPVFYFSEFGHVITHGRDDLDQYDGTIFFNEIIKLPVAIRHYAGFPAGTSTIYLPREINDIELITTTIRSLLEQFNLTTKDVMWERKDNPEL